MWYKDQLQRGKNDPLHTLKSIAAQNQTAATNVEILDDGTSY